MSREPAHQTFELASALDSIFDDMFEGIQIIDRDWRYVYLNQPAAAHGRYPRGQLIGRTMMDAYPGIEETEMFGRITRCMKERTPQRMVNRFTYADGDAAWFDLRMSPVPQGVLILSVDVSEQKAAEEELRRSREDLATTLECIAEGVVTTDVDGRVTGLNPAAEALTGWSLEEARGRPLDELVRLEDRRTAAVINEPVQTVLRDGSGAGFATDTALIGRSGRPIPVRVSAAPMRHGGTVRGVVMVMKDVREETELTSMLHHSQKMEAVGRLAGGVAHDFNNVLSVIVGYGDLVLDAVPDGDPIRGWLAEIVKAAERGTTLTRQLLTFSRKSVYEPVELDVNEIITHMGALLRRVIGEDIELIVRLAPDVDGVRFDPAQVEQIIMNLTMNARDAMPDGGRLVIETANVELDEHYVHTHPDAQEGPHVMIAVTDTGQGMDELTRERIFEPFFTTKASGKGTGLGLSTLYGNVKQGGGNVWVYSEAGRGTSVKVYLPRAVETAPTRPAPTAVEAPAPTGHETILVVEDEPAVRDMMRRVLERGGYTVLDAGDARAAVQRSKDHDGPIHLLLTDVVLPGTGGPGMAELLRQDRPALKVAYMSGYADDAIVHHGILEPGTAFIEKPLTSKVLLRKVREFLRAGGPAKS
ncbi:MAG: PAS domain S-box protein [Gemmatimonadota bacterium]